MSENSVSLDIAIADAKNGAEFSLDAIFDDVPEHDASKGNKTKAVAAAKHLQRITTTNDVS